MMLLRLPWPGTWPTSFLRRGISGEISTGISGISGSSRGISTGTAGISGSIEGNSIGTSGISEISGGISTAS